MNAYPDSHDGSIPATPVRSDGVMQRGAPASPSVVDAIARVRFAWDAQYLKCRATAYDLLGRMLGEVIVELPEDVRKRIWLARGSGAQLRVEEIAEKHLRSMLELRY